MAGLIASLQAFALTLPAAALTKISIRNHDNEFLFSSPQGQKLEVYVYKDNVEIFYEWAVFEYFDLSIAEACEIIHICESVRDGGVWQISSKSRGFQTTIFRSPDNGPDKWIRDSRASCGYCIIRKKNDWLRQRFPAWSDVK